MAILGRMLANLKHVYGRHDRSTDVVWVLRMRCALPGAPASERAELAAALAAVGGYAEAAAELDALGEDRRATGLRARLN